MFKQTHTNKYTQIDYTFHAAIKNDIGPGRMAQWIKTACCASVKT